MIAPVRIASSRSSSGSPAPGTSSSLGLHQAGEPAGDASKRTQLRLGEGREPSRLAGEAILVDALEPSGEVQWVFEQRGERRRVGSSALGDQTARSGENAPLAGRAVVRLGELLGDEDRVLDLGGVPGAQAVPPHAMAIEALVPEGLERYEPEPAPLALGQVAQAPSGLGAGLGIEADQRRAVVDHPRDEGERERGLARVRRADQGHHRPRRRQVHGTPGVKVPTHENTALRRVTRAPGTATRDRGGPQRQRTTLAVKPRRPLAPVVAVAAIPPQLPADRDHARGRRPPRRSGPHDRGDVGLSREHVGAGRAQPVDGVAAIRRQRSRGRDESHQRTRPPQPAPAQHLRRRDPDDQRGQQQDDRYAEHHGHEELLLGLLWL
jgi:hypothetical protein